MRMFEKPPKLTEAEQALVDKSVARMTARRKVIEAAPVDNQLYFIDC